MQGVTVGSGQGAGLVSLQQLLQQQAGYLQHGVVPQHYLPQPDTHTLGHGAVVAAQQGEQYSCTRTFEKFHSARRWPLLVESLIALSHLRIS